MALNRYITSSMTGAPTVSGTAGEFATMMQAVLVDGFNSGTCTAVQTAGTCTATRTSHGFVVGQVVHLSGAVQSEYNGYFRVLTVPNANDFTFAVSSGAVSPATGTITCKTAPLGWATTYTASNKRVFTMGTGSLGHVLQILDTGTPGATVALTTMGESATDVDTLVDPYPTAAQVAQVTSGFFHHYKSTTANSTTRAWIVVGDEKSVLVLSKIDGTSYRASYFGEIERASSTDVWASICAAQYSSTTITTNSRDGVLYNTANSLTANTVSSNAPTAFIARLADGTTKSVSVIRQPPLTTGTTNQIFGDSGLVRSVHNATFGLSGQPMLWDITNLRGFFRGVFNPYKTLVDGTTYNSADMGMPAGTTLLGVKIFGGASDAGWAMVQKDGTLP